jgi:uncharacterized protein (DUF58 family)
MLQKIRDTFLPARFFQLFGGLAALFVLSFAFPLLLPFVQALFFLALAAVLGDWLLLGQKAGELHLKRILPRTLSMGDNNPIRLRMYHAGAKPLHFELIDELPEQLQIRDFSRRVALQPEETKDLHYSIRPTTRGSYAFGAVQVFFESALGLVQLRHRYALSEDVPVYPSILQMKQFELLALNQSSLQAGLKKIRRIGHSYEFDQIKNYVRGDDYRSINWKATSRSGELMVNQYEDERAQQVYCLIDKSRNMRMPFEGLSLMDYAINTSLMISNVVLQKHDKAGLLSFSDRLGSTIVADRKSTQLHRILQALYREEPSDKEANYELLYLAARKFIPGRSLLFLFCNLESRFALERVLPTLRRLNRQHLLVVIFFKNTEVQARARQSAETLAEVYSQTIARKFLSEKDQMVQTLRQFGIQSVYSTPEDLSISTLNKYLELKSRGLI